MHDVGAYDGGHHVDFMYLAYAACILSLLWRRVPEFAEYKHLSASTHWRGHLLHAALLRVLLDLFHYGKLLAVRAVSGC